jgi:predicted SprT family Zn-dependent metalloprotease
MEIFGVFQRELRRFPQLVDQGYKLDLMNRRTHLGLCCYSTRTISLSKPYLEVGTDEDIRDTILHELAHALAGPGAGHGPLWKRQCLIVGCKPQRCGEGKFHDAREDAKYRLKCSDCDYEWGFLRRPKHTSYTHPKCRFKPNRGKMIFVNQEGA